MGGGVWKPPRSMLYSTVLIAWPPLAARKACENSFCCSADMNVPITLAKAIAQVRFVKDNGWLVGAWRRA
jgi:hypothetical protein